MNRRQVVVVADSLAFHGPERAEPTDDPRIFPSIIGTTLDADVQVFARMGWTTRDAWWSLAGDPALWSALKRADAVVLAVNGMDYLPTVLPTFLREGIRLIRPRPLRQAVRKVYGRVQPRLALVSRGRARAIPQRLTDEYLSLSVRAIRAVRPDIVVVGIVPPPHCAPAYGRQMRGHAAAVAAALAWSRREHVPLADLPDVVQPHLDLGEHNPDGIHYAWQTHRDVGTAIAAVIRADRRWLQST